MLDPIVKKIEVLCDQQKAFTVFLDEMAEGVHRGYSFDWGLIFEQAYKETCGS
jgi:hypothetical protein